MKLIFISYNFFSDDGDAWSLAYSNTDILYLETSTSKADELGLLSGSVNSSVNSRGRAVSRPVAVIPPPSQSLAVGNKRSSIEEPLQQQKPVPPPRHSLSGGQLQQQHTNTIQQPSMSPRRENLLEGGAAAAASASPHSRTPSPGAGKLFLRGKNIYFFHDVKKNNVCFVGDSSRKPSFFQKLFKGDSIKRTASQSPPTSRKPFAAASAAVASANKDIPPELMGVSVKELVKVIGESRANGNGVTPPGTPATPKRASRSASPQVSSRGSSPSSVRLTSGSGMFQFNFSKFSEFLFV